MKVYDVESGYGSTQTHSVVAETMGEAERIYTAKYWPITIRSIKLHSEYVQIQGWDEQARHDKQEDVP